MKLIDKDAVLAEIDRIENGLMDAQGNFAYREDEGAYYTLCSVENFINTLEVKEVDINKEISQFIDTNFEKTTIGYKLSLRRVAKYFFELGLKAQKGE